jgi:hypothetical protein
MSMLTPPNLYTDLQRGYVPELCQSEHAGLIYLADDDRPVGGPMAPLLGLRFSREQIEQGDMMGEFEEDRWLAAFVRAWPVTPLVGGTFCCERDSLLQESLQAVLDNRCPGVGLEMGAERELHGPLRKCGFVHTSVSAPPDEETGQPMAVEVFATVTRLGGRPLNPGIGWIDDWRSRQGEDYLNVEVVASMEFELEVATYANVSNPSVGVPFYM